MRRRVQVGHHGPVQHTQPIHERGHAVDLLWASGVVDVLQPVKRRREDARTCAVARVDEPVVG
jgi:hypothetical protein